MKKISGYMLICNEVSRIKIAIEHMLNLVDNLFILDGGSTDGTIDIIKQFPEVKYEVYAQEGERNGEYGSDGKGYGWNEPIRRQYCVETAVYDWIFTLDVDELMDCNKEYLCSLDKPTLFPRYNLLTEDMYIVKNGNDAWYPDLQLRFLKKGTKYTNSALHCFPIVNERFTSDRHMWHYKRCIINKEIDIADTITCALVGSSKPNNHNDMLLTCRKG